MISALKKENKTSLTIKNKSAALIDVALEFESASGRKFPFTISLEKKSVALEEQFGALLKRMGPLAQCVEDRFTTCHTDMKLFHGNLAVVKFQGGSGWIVATLGTLFTQGKHYLECKIIRALSNHVMIGVQESTTVFAPYPGASPLSTGKGFYGSNGHCYFDNSSSDYGLGTFGAGDYVGALLDMDNKNISFTLNGREGATRPLAGNAYCFVVSVHSVGDAVEILPEFCYHRS